MLIRACPKLPMRDKQATKHYYIHQLGFEDIGTTDYPDYLMVSYQEVELHFFLYKELNPLENYGQVYIRVNNIKEHYMHWQRKGVAIHPNGELTLKPWGVTEFSFLDPDHNLLTFGE